MMFQVKFKLNHLNLIEREKVQSKLAIFISIEITKKEN